MSEEYGVMTHSYQEIDALPEALAEEATARAAADTAQVAKIADIMNSGAKNLLRITQINLTRTINGVTATYDPVAGTVELNGTYDGGSGTIFELYTGAASDQAKIPAGTYHMSGCPAGGSNNSYRVSLNGITAVDSGDGVDFTISEPKALAARILISGTPPVFNHMVFKMMVCEKSDYDASHAFAPYCPTAYEMYAASKQPLVGKKISFYGDSITTFTGWLPSGNKPFYTGSNCGVNNVYQTWWMQTVQGTGAELCVDQAWSAST